MKRILYTALLATAFIPAIANAETNSSSTNSGVSNHATTSSAISGSSQNAANAMAGSNLSRADVVQIQQNLTSRGFLRGTNDGVWGPSTANALRRFQLENSLGGTGDLDTNTLNELGVQLSMDSNSSSSGRSMSTLNAGSNTTLRTRIGTDQATTNDNMSGGANSSSSADPSQAPATSNNASGGASASIGVGGNTSSTGQ